MCFIGQSLNLKSVTSQACKKDLNSYFLFFFLKPKLKQIIVNQQNGVVSSLDFTSSGKELGMGRWSVQGWVCARGFLVFSYFNRWRSVGQEARVGQFQKQASVSIKAAGEVHCNEIPSIFLFTGFHVYWHLNSLAPRPLGLIRHPETHARLLRFTKL